MATIEIKASVDGKPFQRQRYVEIRRNGRNAFMRVAGSMNGFVSGYRVSKSGETFERETKEAIQRELIVTTESNVIREMRMNLHYAELEPVP